MTSSPHLNRRHHGPKARCRGYLLIDVLVSVFVLSVGLLAVANLQILSKKSNYEAIQRTTATWLAQDIIERMRANPEVAIETTDYLTQLDAAPGTNCSTAVCTPSQMALHDRWEWQQAVLGATETVGGNAVGGLVSPTLCISRTTVDNNNQVTVAIAWRGRERVANPTASTCGDASGLYNDPDPGAVPNNNAFRRLLVVNTFIGS